MTLCAKVCLFRDFLGWLLEFIAKFLQFQPKVQQKILIADVLTTVLPCLEEDYNTVVEMSALKTSAELRVGIEETSR